MDNKANFKFFDSLRENVLLIAVFYMLLPAPSIKPTTVNIMWLVIVYAMFGSMLWRTAGYAKKDEMLFLYDKVLFIITLCIEGCLMAVKPFVTIPIMVETITLSWAFILAIVGFVWAFTYPSMEKKGKWKHSIAAEEAAAMAFNNYLTMAISLLAINHVIF